MQRLEEEIVARDAFYLFWSSHARESEWVEREWRIALQRKGLEFIEPVPLESPTSAPPPTELACLHFDEWTLAYESDPSEAYQAFRGRMPAVDPMLRKRGLIAESA